MRLLREIPEHIVPARREIWLVKETCEVLVYYRGDKCSISLLNTGSQVPIKKAADSLGVPYRITSGIDCEFVEIQRAELEKLLEALDQSPYELKSSG